MSFPRAYPLKTCGYKFGGNPFPQCRWMPDNPGASHWRQPNGIAKILEQLLFYEYIEFPSLGLGVGYRGLFRQKPTPDPSQEGTF